MAALMDAEREKEEAAKARSIAQSLVLAKAACPILHIGLWTEPLFIPQGMLQI
ncbi:hypothetical protein NmNIID838_05180 [Neisseria meningitidis]|nr:hypothetical protein NmNIID835_05140 [Neisseria meningitidis]BEQ21167.1 hypothetical protein NmNIID836_17590 [Neisseria meningitidis]BEQ21985.1 hypothetical protein NmNIID838_05180 [Neisseria meningitidis]